MVKCITRQLSNARRRIENASTDDLVVDGMGLSKVSGPFRFVSRIAHLGLVRCKWKWAKRRLLCGLGAVKYLHVGVDDA